GRDRRGVLSFGYLFFAQAKKSDSLAAASETKTMRQIVPLACVASWIRIDHKQVPRLRLGMTVVSE
ncbi:hypothetical protein, partial [Lysobacter hankyongensis]|uniref:hypothetical protein n=1 Tax=Lysobacter hankyongensis TaxID=1176535 RepID=UPI0031F1329F